MGFEFIHCGDLHLGCFPNRIEERYFDFFNAFNNLITYAINKKIKLILISGDLFHLKMINSKTLQNTIDSLTIAKNNNIEVIVIEGNHDKAFYVDEDSWLCFLNNQGYIKLLQTPINDGQVILNPYDNLTGGIIETEDYRIIGLGYMGGATEKYLQSVAKIIKPSPKFTILMLHAAINRLVGQDMGDIKGDEILDLRTKVDYIALGHIHNKYQFNDFAYNPGSLENIRLKDGLTMDDKGFYHVSVNDDKTFNANHINSHPRFVLNKAINVTGLKNAQAIEKEIMSTDFKLLPLEMLNLNLVGKINYNPYTIKTKEIGENLKNKYQLLHIEINNNVNISTDENTNTEFDFNGIIKNIICQDLKFNDPNIKNAEDIALSMMELTDIINEEAPSGDQIKTVESYLMKLGDKL